MAVCGVNSGREKLVMNRIFNLHLSCFTHRYSEKRWGTVSSSILQHEHRVEELLLKRKLCVYLKYVIQHVILKVA